MATEFDFAQLDAITGGDVDFEREVLEEYLNTAPLDVAGIQAAVHAGDAGTTDAMAHSLKGASATIGATGLAAIALQLEHAGKRGELTGLAPVIARLDAEFAELCTLLQGRIRRAG